MSAAYPSPGPRAQLSAVSDRAYQTASHHRRFDLVRLFPLAVFCAQAQRDSIRTSIRKNAITRFDVLFITVSFQMSLLHTIAQMGIASAPNGAERSSFWCHPMLSGIGSSASIRGRYQLS